MKQFIATLSHDGGKSKVNIQASNKTEAISRLMSLEGCPSCAIKIKPLRTIDKIIYEVDGRRGAPMGRSNVGDCPNNFPKHSEYKKVFDCAVPMSSCGAYDKGGAYWGIGKQLRVKYTKDLSYIKFYRRGDL